MSRFATPNKQRSSVLARPPAVPVQREPGFRYGRGSTLPGPSIKGRHMQEMVVDCVRRFSPCTTTRAHGPTSKMVRDSNVFIEESDFLPLSATRPFERPEREDRSLRRKSPTPFTSHAAATLSLSLRDSERDRDSEGETHSQQRARSVSPASTRSSHTHTGSHTHSHAQTHAHAHSQRAAPLTINTESSGKAVNADFITVNRRSSPQRVHTHAHTHTQSQHDASAPPLRSLSSSASVRSLSSSATQRTQRTLHSLSLSLPSSHVTQRAITPTRSHAHAHTHAHRDGDNESVLAKLANRAISSTSRLSRSLSETLSHAAPSLSPTRSLSLSQSAYKAVRQARVRSALTEFLTKDEEDRLTQHPHAHAYTHAHTHTSHNAHSDEVLQTLLSFDECDYPTQHSPLKSLSTQNTSLTDAQKKELRKHHRLTKMTNGLKQAVIDEIYSFRGVTVDTLFFPSDHTHAHSALSHSLPAAAREDLVSLISLWQSTFYTEGAEALERYFNVYTQTKRARRVLLDELSQAKNERDECLRKKAGLQQELALFVQRGRDLGLDFSPLLGKFPADWMAAAEEQTQYTPAQTYTQAQREVDTFTEAYAQQEEIAQRLQKSTFFSPETTQHTHTHTTGENDDHAFSLTELSPTQHNTAVHTERAASPLLEADAWQRDVWAHSHTVDVNEREREVERERRESLYSYALQDTEQDPSFPDNYQEMGLDGIAYGEEAAQEAAPLSVDFDVIRALADRDIVSVRSVGVDTTTSASHTHSNTHTEEDDFEVPPPPPPVELQL